MIHYESGSDTAVIVLHEIYGLNRHIREFCQVLWKAGFDAIAPDLLGNERVFNEDQEEAAYQHFIKQIGFENAELQVKAVLNEARMRYRRIILVGFSVGATVAWLCCRDAGLCDAGVCFYGSRIRDYLEQQPACPVLLFFPEKEKGFEVSEIIMRLNDKPFVAAKQIQGEHGFANPESIHYNQQSARLAWKETMSFISSISTK